MDTHMLKKQALICGIDPGFTGAIAFFDPKLGPRGEITHIFDIPTGNGHESAWRSKKKSDRVRFDVPSIAKIFLDHKTQIDFVVMERAFPTPQMGVTGCYRYGHGCGVLEGILSALQIRTYQVAPSVWKPASLLDRNKVKSRQVAISKWPNMSHLFKREMDHGRAEAAILAEYGLRFKGETPMVPDPLEAFS